MNVVAIGDADMAALPYMRFYVADYLADAAHLSTLQHGAYCLLIMTYWQRGEALPDNDKKLARIVRMSDREWSDNRDDLAEFFSIEDGLWRHGRIERELDDVRSKSEQARNAGKASAQRRSSGRSTDEEHQSNHTDTDTDTTSSTKGKRAKALAVKPDDVEASVWDDFQKLRKVKRAPLTDTALKGIVREAGKAGLSINDALAMCCERGWQGFKAEWIKEGRNGNANGNGRASGWLPR